MAHRRTLDWSSEIRSLETRRSVSPFLTAAGRFDLRAIMCAAIAEARRIGRTLGLSWNDRLSIALRLIWAKAKSAVASTTRRLAA